MWLRSTCTDHWLFMRGKGIGRAIGIACMTAITLIAVSSAFAGTVETMLMPGKVTRPHEKQEQDCANCHDRSNVRTQSSLCLDCHKDIAADVRDHKDYHGRMQNAGTGECRACHTEHKGRAADIVQLSRAQFDHRLTDFALEGAHSALACESCHKPGEAWRGQLPQSSGECHGSLSWTGGKFDHDKTDFKLTGTHTTVTCNAC